MSAVILLHGTFVDEFLIEIVLPLSIFAALYWWSTRRGRTKKKEATKRDLPDQPPGP
jgi:hypothetical protein